MAKQLFTRYGGINFYKQKGYRTNGCDMDYHSAPEKYGFYCFPHKWEEWFLLGGTKLVGKTQLDTFDLVQRRLMKKRQFYVDGYIWVHILEESIKSEKKFIIESRGCWYKIRSRDYGKVLSKRYASLNAQSYDSYDKDNRPKEPMERGKWNKMYSRDEFEVFIPRGCKIISYKER